MRASALVELDVSGCLSVEGVGLASFGEHSPNLVMRRGPTCCHCSATPLVAGRPRPGALLLLPTLTPPTPPPARFG